MVGVMRGQVNESRGVGGGSTGLLLKNRRNTSLRFPFACLANKRCAPNALCYRVNGKPCLLAELSKSGPGANFGRCAKSLPSEAGF
jgi:hypothetical protein